ncbi:MAG: winged helix-turn-helix transcriptional regulator [Clostridia bacterium]|nr:winged helix-turn-helix transcriptional regulator [Clostridia bacterium]MBR6742213.1 winged helix-turn-helix transcriptional regulator [Clostridia bacterium]
MQIRLLESPNIIYECSRIITDYVDNISFRALKEELRGATRAEAQILDGCFDSIIEFTEKITGSLTYDSSVLTHLFATRAELNSSLASYILHSAFCSESPAFPEDAEKIRTLSKNVFFANIYSLLLARFPQAQNEVKVESYGEIINLISALPLSSELKWEVCSFYNNFEQMRSVLADIMLEAGKLYTDNYPKVRHHVEWFVANYKMTASADPIKLVYELCPDAKGKDPADVLYIIPTVASAADSVYLMDFVGEKITDCVYAGVLCTPLKNITDKPFDEKGMCRAMRLMGDNSKLAILRLTSERAMYGIEIAEALSLTTATVSHHMSQLSDAGLVVTERYANRIYYRANTEALALLADDFIRVFRLERE